MFEEGKHGNCQTTATVIKPQHDVSSIVTGATVVCLFLAQYDIRNSPNLCLSLRTKFKFNHNALFYCSWVFMCFCIVWFDKQSSWFFFSFKNWFSLKNRPIVVILWFPHIKLNRCCLINSSMCNLHFHAKFSRERSLKTILVRWLLRESVPRRGRNFLVGAQRAGHRLEVLQL